MSGRARIVTTPAAADQSSQADIPAVSALPSLTAPQLRALWPRVMRPRPGAPAPPMPLQRSMVLRELAWRLQEWQLPGGAMDEQTQRLLNAAVRGVRGVRGVLRAATPQSPCADDAIAARAAPKPISDPHGTSRRRVPSLPAGTKLLRTYRGVTHEVIALEPGRGFLYRGRTYPSLTGIAMEITGTAWSGPRFFGVTTRSRGAR